MSSANREGAAAGGGLAILRLLSRRALRQGLVFGAVFGVTVASSVTQFTEAYPTPESRRQIATTVGGNGAVQALFGAGRALDSVPGWTAWRSLGIVTILGSIWALLAATRWLREEEDSGRWELLVAGATTRRRAAAQAVGALGVAVGALWVGTAAVVLASSRAPESGFGLRAGLFLALTLVVPAAVFLAVGAVAAQVAPSRRHAAQLAAAAFGACFGLRMLGASVAGLRWVLWLTPLGWAQHLHPLTGSSILPLIPLALLVGALVAGAVALAGRRDTGAGLLPARDTAPPRVALLGSPLGLTVRLQRGTWLVWLAALALASVLFGVIATAIAATSSTALEGALARLGARQAGVAAYLGIFYLVLGAAVACAAAGQVAATRDEEADGRADTLLVHPRPRSRWLAGRLAASAGAVGTLALVTGVGGWLGTAGHRGGISLAGVVGAGLNTIPPALLVLGVGTLAHGLLPRRAATVAYGIVGWSFLVSLLGATAGGGRWLADLSVFHHVAPMPAAPFRAGGAALLAGLGVAGMAAGTALFRRRDLAGP